MFSIYSNGVLIGQSALESGDPPMGVAFGQFVPTAAFGTLRNQMESHGSDLRVLSGLSARTEDDVALNCEGVAVFEAGEAGNPTCWEVTCLGVEYPQYGNLFPDHVKAYEDQSKE